MTLTGTERMVRQRRTHSRRRAALGCGFTRQTPADTAFAPTLSMDAMRRETTGGCADRSAAAMNRFYPRSESRLVFAVDAVVDDMLDEDWHECLDAGIVEAFCGLTAPLQDLGVGLRAVQSLVVG